MPPAGADHDASHARALQRLMAASPPAPRPGARFSCLSVLSIMKAIFLPEGYPASTSSDYISYQLWDTAQAVCSSAVRVITTEALLKSLGVGDSSATALSATLQFVARDLLGKLARVFFCAFKGSEFDRNPKFWRLVADITNDATACCDLLMPLAPPPARIALICVSSLCSAICGISGAATRSSLTQHFALKGNFGDIAAKDDSQEMAVGIIGLCVGMVLAHLVTGSSTWSFAAFAMLTLAHLACNYAAVCSVRLTTISDERMGALVTLIARSRTSSKALRLPTPEDVRKIEGIIACKHTRSDVVLCSSVGFLNIIGRTKAPPCTSSYDTAIISSREGGDGFIVLSHHGRVHVFASNDCGADALVYAAFVAYCHALSVSISMTFQDFREQMAAAGWNLATHQLRLGDHRLQNAPSHDKSS